MSPETVRLYKWSPALVRGNLYFMGLKEQTPSDMWRTSKVVDRRGSKKVVTITGKVYELVGKPVILGELRGTVPVWLQEKFLLGIPRNWEEVVGQWGWVRRLERAKAEEELVTGCSADGKGVEDEPEDAELCNISPMKMVKGISYNYSCIYCSLIPRSICRSELYRHYAVRHFANQLRAEFGKVGRFCGDCKKEVRTSNWVTHMGQVHGKVEIFLPIEARLPGGRNQGRG